MNPYTEDDEPMTHNHVPTNATLEAENELLREIIRTFFADEHVSREDFESFGFDGMLYDAIMGEA